MSGEMSMQINLTLKDIKKILCKKCRNELRRLVKEQVQNKLTERMVNQALGEDT